MHIPGGRGRSLFEGLTVRRRLEVVYHRDYGPGAVQYMVRPAR